jgi:hypothetical protein
VSLVKVNKQKILKEFGIEKLEKSQQEKIWLLVTDIFQTKILDYILSQFEEEDKEEFMKVLLEDEEKSEKFIVRKLPGIDAKIIEVIEKTKAELVLEFKGARGR